MAEVLSIEIPDMDGVRREVAALKQVVDRVGEVQATPTVNTLLSRIKALETVLGVVGDAAWSGSGDGTLIAIQKKLDARFAAGFTMTGSVTIADGEGVKGQVTHIRANPTSVLTRPANTTAYTALDVIASSTTAPVVPSISMTRNAAGNYVSDRLRLVTSKTSGMGGINVLLDLFTGGTGGSTPPTNANDNAAYVRGTGAANYIGTFRGSFIQFTDGAAALLQIDGWPARVKNVAGQAAYWTLQAITGFTPDSAQTFTLTGEPEQG